MMSTENILHRGPISSNNTSYECIILAGGLGTRLRTSVPDLPKCMAPVAGNPFLKYVIDYLIDQQVDRFIFSLGYRHEYIEDFLKNKYPDLQYKIALEKEPLGTGGAIMLASKYTSAKNVIILNGDTLFKVNIHSIMSVHEQNNASCTLSLKPMHDFDRYGVVEINKDGYIQQFQEKKYYPSGLINGGVYALNINNFNQINFPEKFSFEKDYLESYFNTQKMMGIIQDDYFIDIGIPEDFERASKEIF